MDALFLAFKFFNMTDSFQEGMINTIVAGLDADSIVAVYGQIVDAFYVLGRDKVILAE
jgi:ADP-ribosylglycohydrolase